MKYEPYESSIEKARYIVGQKASCVLHRNSRHVEPLNAGIYCYLVGHFRGVIPTEWIDTNDPNIVTVLAKKIDALPVNITYFVAEYCNDTVRIVSVSPVFERVHAEAEAISRNNSPLYFLRDGVLTTMN